MVVNDLLVVVDDLTVLVDGLLVVEETVEALEVVLVPPVIVPPVDPISPHRMLLNTTCVLGLFCLIKAGLPSVEEQGPLLPLSSQFIYPEASFQMENTSVMPRLRAWPIVGRDPNVAADESA